MYLIVDIGNTLAKFFVYEKGQCVVKHSIALEQFQDEMQSLISSHSSIKGIVYSDVSDHAGDFFKKLAVRFNVLSVDSQLRLPFENAYQSPESLGSDRIVLVAAASKNFPHTNVLIIDLGTCITYDFLSSDQIYHGGAISPGFEMRYKSLHHFTGRLPSLDCKAVKDPEGKTTSDAIHAGIYYGILDEIEARINYYESRYKSLTVILTGGDANKLPKTLKNSIFAHSNFVAEGMLHLLKLNMDS